MVIVADNPSVLVLESDPGLRRLFDTVLRRDAFEPIFVEDGEAAVHLLARRDVAALIVDLSLAASSLEVGSRRGIGFLHYLQREKPLLLQHVVVLSGLVPRDVPRDLPNVFLFLRKPFELDELRAAIRACARVEASVQS